MLEGRLFQDDSSRYSGSSWASRSLPVSIVAVAKKNPSRAPKTTLKDCVAREFIASILDSLVKSQNLRFWQR